MNANPLHNFLGYGAAALMQGLVAFATVPMLIRVLGVDDFALWAIFEPVVASMAQLALLGACHGFIRLLASGLERPARLYDAQLRHGWPALTLVSVLGATGLSLYLGFEHRWMTVLWASVFVALEALLLMILSVHRGSSHAGRYAMVVWVRYGLVGIVVTAMALSDWHLRMYQYLMCLVVIDVLALLAGASPSFASKDGHARRTSEALERSTKAVYWTSVQYGMPIVLTSVLAMIVANGDRYVVHALMRHDQLAGYVTMAKLAGAMAFASAPINLWWPSARFKHANDPDQGAAFYSSATMVLLAYYVIVAMLASLLAPMVIRWYGQGVTGYDPISMVLLLGSAVTTAMVTPMNVGTLNEGKTHWSIWGVAISAVLGLVGAYWLIPRHGYVGAAGAALLAQLAYLILIHLISQRIQPLNFEYRKPLVLVLIFVMSMIGLLQLQATSMVTWLGFLCFAAFTVFMCRPDLKKVLTI
jgi:O-antigen/teichoic acid export membrane protein